MTITTTKRRDRNDRLRAVAAPQFGMFTWAQALRCGFPPSTLALAVREGEISRVQPEVYRSGVGPLDLDARRAAALLSSGPEAALTGRAALGVFECSRFRSRAVQVGVPRRRKRRLRNAELRISRAAELGYVIVHRGHRVTSFAWTVTDLGIDLEAHQLAHVIQQGRLRGFVQLREIDAVLAARGRFPGRAVVRRALAMYRARSAGTRSWDEDRVYAWASHMVRQMPLPNTHIRAGDQEFEIDLPFRSRMLCIEIDGPYHDDPDQQERDRVRDAALRAAGFRVLRLHWRDIRDRPEWCKDQLRAALA